ncbi:Mechanosensitive ion channel [Natronoarchaeum philippinense]|uniref:Mechanosensitive ion channel n=1 Tax=Natronoarchaeum philippinense TaxID=558529 RepID=A0A285N2D0_NATPI|nr:mechanosensitive ion channel family protein [Natronoarchaeum philippinense]SNZ03478.1 Mechanosensitive ion channel [Natronoarchaeum philippinense]
MGVIAVALENVGIDGVVGQTIESAALFLIAFAVVYVLGKTLIMPLAGRTFDRRGLDDHAKKPLLRLVWALVLFAAVGVAFAAGGFGNILTSLATIAAAGALAIGLAMQNIISNFVSGVFIYADKPFRIGDWIEWNGNSGVVEDISLRVTRVRTFDNELLTVPNSDLTSNVVKNPVAKEQLRLKFVFGIGYEDDIEQATDIIVEEAEDHPDILDEPGPSVRLTELADSYVGLQSRIWIDNPSRADYVKTRGEYITNVKARFDEVGIDIPYPQRELSGGVEMAEHAEIPQSAE